MPRLRHRAACYGKRRAGQPPQADYGCASMAWSVLKGVWGNTKVRLPSRRVLSAAKARILRCGIRQTNPGVRCAQDPAWGDAAAPKRGRAPARWVVRGPPE